MLAVQNQEPQKKYKNPSTWASIGGFAAGIVAQNIVGGVSLPIAGKIVDRMKQISDLPDDEFKQVETAIDKALNDTGLSKNGVTIKKVPTVEVKSYMDKCLALADPIESTKQGNNSYYSKNTEGTLFDKFKKLLPKEKAEALKSKTIYRPEKNLSLLIFHEMGHAANEHFSKIGRLLQKIRGPLMKLAPITILLIGLLKTKKAPDEKPKKTTDKVNTFIKNNAGKLTFLALTPMLIEEAMASIKGYSFAKEAGLSKDLLAKVAKTNNIAYFGSYFASAVLGSLGIALAIKVKDAIAHKKLKKVKPKADI